MAYITSDGANIFVDVAGAGAPVLCVHGFGLDHRQWDPQRAALAASHEVFRMDRRGHGLSDTSATDHDAGVFASDVARALVQIGMDRLHPGFLVAHGDAAEAALRAAASEPRAVRGVIVVSPQWSGQEAPADWLDVWKAMGADARAGSVAAAFARYRGDAACAGLRDRPQVWALVRDMQSRCAGAEFLAQAGAGDSALEAMARCSCPVLVMSGGRDREAWRRTAAGLAARLPRGRWLEVPAAVHYPNLETPAAFQAAVQDFLAAAD